VDVPMPEIDEKIQIGRRGQGAADGQAGEKLSAGGWRGWRVRDVGRQRGRDASKHVADWAGHQPPIMADSAYRCELRRKSQPLLSH